MPEHFDPCEEVRQLRDARRQIVLGEGMAEARFGEDFVRFGRADLAALDRLIADAERRCAAARGKPRARHARTVRFRPY